MGADPAARRAWLGRLRARFFGADRFRTGTLSEDELVRSLRELGVGLSRAEEARLLGALQPDARPADVGGGADGGAAREGAERGVGRAQRAARGRDGARRGGGPHDLPPEDHLPPDAPL